MRVVLLGPVSAEPGDATTAELTTAHRPALQLRTPKAVDLMAMNGLPAALT
jgi:hypothetical protein